MTMLRYAMDIDWELLVQQKLFLLQLIDADAASPNGLTSFGSYGKEDHPLEGIVNLLDSIQDQAESLGEKVYPEEDEDANADAE